MSMTASAIRSAITTEARIPLLGTAESLRQRLKEALPFRISMARTD